MRHILAIISAIPLLVPDARAQSPNPGMSTQATRAMIAVSEMGRSTVGAEGSSRSLKFEEGDDPTVVAHPVPPHEPLRAARKVAEAAEHLAKKNEHQEAIAKYREAVALDPLYFEAWNNLALELQDAGTPNEAEQVFRRLMQSNPEHVLVFTNLVSPETVRGGGNRRAPGDEASWLLVQGQLRVGVPAHQPGQMER